MAETSDTESCDISCDVSRLNTEESSAFFGEGSHHVPVSLKHLKNARMLWLNRKVAAGDPNFDQVGCDIALYEQHILSACAYAMETEPGSEASSNDDITVGYADRYGGPGIGLNGGSGRTAVVNGYLVKGIGRTPLVSSLTGESHASGGAYLEESIRETIYTEIAAAEFPCSAISVLAIIDTGLTQTFQEAVGQKVEWRTLVIRPCFLRPAHFERATAYFSGNPKEGSQDTLRVSRFFEQAIATFGKDGLAEKYRALWPNWARQLAYSFIHRLPHGSNTVSNICLDGKLLDFGAMSAVPSWANAATMLSPLTFGMQFKMLPGMIRTSGYFFGRYLDAQFGNEQAIAALTVATQREHCRMIVVEALRLCGVPRIIAEAAAVGPDLESLWHAIVLVIDHFQKERIYMVESAPAAQIEWDLHRVWDEVPPVHLSMLHAHLKHLVPPGDQAAAAKRCALLSAARTNLFREQAKREIFAALDASHRGEKPDRNQIEQFINEQVAQGRRDHRFEVDDAVPIGFAVNSVSSYVLFKELRSERIFGIAESQVVNRHKGVNDRRAARHYVEDYSTTSIRFRDADVLPFEGAVRVY